MPSSRTASTAGTSTLPRTLITSKPPVYDVPPPDERFVDHVLGRADRADYLLDLHHAAARPVREWLDGPAVMRIMSSAYDPAHDFDYYQSIESWRAGFDAILHVDAVEATRLL